METEDLSQGCITDEQITCSHATPRSVNTTPDEANYDARASLPALYLAFVLFKKIVKSNKYDGNN